MAIGKFQIRDATSWKGLTDSNHINAIFKSGPQKVSETYIRLLEHNYGRSMESFLMRFPVKYFENDEDMIWKLIGSARKNIPLYEARDCNGAVITPTTMAGVNTEPFYLVFQEDYFADGNFIVGEKNEEYLLIVKNDPKIEGSLYVYEVELAGGNVSGMPGSELQPGKRFSDEYSAVEKDLSRKVGDVRYAGPITMRNEFSHIRLQHKVPGSMLKRKIECGIPVIDPATKNVKVETLWMHFVEWTVEQQFSKDKNYCLMYARSNRSTNGEVRNFGKSGNVISTGAGIREQMSYGNQVYYNSFSLKLLENALFELSTGVLGFNQRNFVIETGERGAAKFSEEVLKTTSGWQANVWIPADTLGMVGKTTNEISSNALKAGFQFTEYLFANNIRVTVKVNPFYDDSVRNKLTHPVFGGPAESYRYDIYYIGNSDEPNIQLCKVNGQEEVRRIQAGLRDPFESGASMAFDEDAAVIHRFATLGAIVLDPMRTMSFIPSILAA